MGRFRESNRFYAGIRSIHTSEFSKQWYIVESYSRETPNIYNFSVIIVVPFVKDQQVATSYKTSTVSAIPRGAVDGLPFGSLGALACAATAKKKGNSEVSMKNSSIIIFVRDFANLQV